MKLLRNSQLRSLVYHSQLWNFRGMGPKRILPNSNNTFPPIFVSQKRNIREMISKREGGNTDFVHTPTKTVERLSSNRLILVGVNQDMNRVGYTPFVYKLMCGI
mmetsp:Transcript_8492/g.8649  ORF Transcript_8492/g.8649 Transcript_8492/m.8649 type:complete len:104 (-) Transcript_8492:67-378(-)